MDDLSTLDCVTPTKQRASFAFGRFFSLWVGYLLLAILLTWPTVTQFTTHLPGDGGDDPAIAWNLWWVKFALLNEGQNPFQTEAMFYPIGINLAFYTLTVLNAVTALPLTLNLGVVTASNLHMLFTFIVGGYGAFLLTHHILRQSHDGNVQPTVIWFSAAIAGSFYAFASSKLFYIALGQFNIGSSHWIPYAILYVVKARQAPQRIKNSVMAGFFLTLQAWAEMTYASFLLVFIGLYWLYWLIAGVYSNYLQNSSQAPFEPPAKFQDVSPIWLHLRSALVIGLTFTLGLAPILAQMVPDMLTEGDFLVVGGGFADVFSADLFGFLIPTMHHPWLGAFIRQSNVTAFDKGQHIYIGVILVGLLLLNLRLIIIKSGLRFWLFASLIFALLTLGPIIYINGQNTGLAGPFVILQQLPFFRGNRYPSRYSVMLMLSLSILAGYSLVQIGAWLDRAKRSHHLLIIGLIALLFFFEHLPFPLPQSDMRIPEPYQIIAADPNDFVVLDIPFAWRNGFRITGALTTQFMFGQFYQTQHQKPMLQGNTSRNPEFKFQYFTQIPIINTLLALETGKIVPPARWDSDRGIAGEVLHFLNIKYIVIRPYRYDTFNGTETIPVTEQTVIPYIEAVLPVTKIHDQPDLKIYQVQADALIQATSQADLNIDTTNPLAPLYFGEGWGLLGEGLPVTAQRKSVRLLLPMTTAATQVSLQIRLPEGYQGSNQTVSLQINGWGSPVQAISQDWAEIKFQVPDGVAKNGLNDVWLHFNDRTTLPSTGPKSACP